MKLYRSALSIFNRNIKTNRFGHKVLNTNIILQLPIQTNYHMIELPEERKRITGYLPSKHSNQKKKKIRQIHFSNHPPQNVGRQGSPNVIKNKPGVHGNARNAATERQAFEV